MNDLAARMVELYDCGLNSKQVAHWAGAGVRRTQRILREHGVVFRHSQRKYKLNENVFDSIDNEHAAYWLGFIYADGCVHKTYLQTILGIKDKDHLNKLRAFLESDSPIYDEVYDVHRSRLTVFSKHMTKRLKELGITVGRKMPAEKLFSHIPPHLFHHWLRGFFDGDGSATRRKVIIFCGHADILYTIRNVLADESGTSPKLLLTKHQSGHMYLRYKGYYNAHKVADFMYRDATVFMHRKRNRILSWKEPMPRAERARLKWKKQWEGEGKLPPPR